MSTKNLDNKSVNVPNLRFPEFEGEWEKYKVSDVLELFSTNSLSWEQLEYGIDNIHNLHYGLIHKGLPVQIDLEKCSLPNIKVEFIPNNYTICKNGDVAFADASEDTNDVAKVVEFYNCSNKKIVCGLHTIHGRDKLGLTITGYKGYAFSANTFRQQIRKLAQGTKIYSISTKNFNESYICIPSKKEQNKITSLMYLIDQRIEAQNKIIEKYESLMRGLRENLFSQELRLKDDNGSDYPDWEVRQLKNIANIQMGQSPDSSSYNLNGIGIPLIQGNADIINRQSNPRQYTSNPTKLCEIGDLILTVRAPVGYIARSLHNACIGRGVCSIKSNEYSSTEFIYQFLLHFENNWRLIEQGSTFTSVNSSDIDSIEIKVPSIEEQTKIANFLLSVDEKLKIEKQILQQLETQKKYLLANMFL